MGVLFGTDGIRGIANEYPMTVEFCHRLAEAVTSIFCASEKKHTVVIGKDTRISGDMLEHAMAASFCSCGVDVKLIGVVPTPAVAILTPQLNASVGVMITASHNSFHYNGIKLFDENGLKLPNNLENDIENKNTIPLLRRLNSQNLGCIEYIPEAVDFYCDKIIGSFHEFSENYKKKIVVDCANGSFSHLAPKILRELGFNVIALHNSPNGININENCGVMHPSVIKNAVLAHKAEVGIAFDGDGDRVLLVDSEGNLQDGEQIFAILAKSGSSKKVVSTILSNSALKNYLESIEIELVEVSVGDRYISEYMQTQNDVEFGAEASGHVIIKSHSLTGDGLFAALKVMEQHGVGNLLFEPNPTISTNLFIKNKDLVKNELVVSAVQKFQEQLSGRGKVIVRQSGTEPILRILVEGNDENELQNITTNLLDVIGKLS
jgi:phosphoglucosamine mutase